MKKSMGSAWARSMGRIGRQMMQAGSKAVGQAIGQSLKQAAQQARQAARTTAKAATASAAAKKAAAKQAARLAVDKPAGRAARQTAGRAVVQPAARPAPPSTRRPPPLTARGPAAARQRAAALVAALPGRWTTGTALAAGAARRWRLYTPPGLEPGERPPLLVLLHGCGQDAAGFAAATGMNRLAERGRFLVLYPEQDRLANAQGCWNWFDTDHGRAQAEADAVLAAIDQVCLRHADRARVVVAGLSAGASLAALLAIRHPARLRGVVMHSGVPPGTAHSTLTALGAMRGRRATAPLGVLAGDGAAAHWPPLLVIHGSLDGVVASRNGAAAALAWADAAGASAAAPRRVQRGRRHAMQVTDYKRRGRVVATLALVQGMGHAWSGGAAGQPFSDPTGPDASRMVWAFAQKLFKAGPSAASSAT